MAFSDFVLSKHTGLMNIEPGEIIDAQVNLILVNDVSGPGAIRQFKRMEREKVWDPDKICFVMDHFTPSCNIQSAENCKQIKSFCSDQGIIKYFDIGKMGIEHALLPELGIARPGNLIIGGDSHTCTYGALGAFSTGVGSTDLAFAMATGHLWFKVPETISISFSGDLPKYVTGKDLILLVLKHIGVSGALYKSLEFTGETINRLSMDGRFTLCNMAVETGAKNGIIIPDEITRKYALDCGYEIDDYLYQFKIESESIKNQLSFNVSDIFPQVAYPNLPSNVHDLQRIEDIKIDQVVIGSCTNGRIEDLRAAAEILKGKIVSSHVRTIIIPATQNIFKMAINEGLIETFITSGAVVSTPTCGPCFGGHMGILAAGERAVSTTNRNFIGRMGSPNSEVFLANPYVAAASAITGYLTHPCEVER